MELLECSLLVGQKPCCSDLPTVASLVVALLEGYLLDNSLLVCHGIVLGGLALDGGLLIGWWSPCILIELLEGAPLLRWWPHHIDVWISQ